MIKQVALYAAIFALIILMMVIFNFFFGEYGQALWFIAFICTTGLARLFLARVKKQEAAAQGSLPDTQPFKS
ncbi:hypothetical protein [Deinococcus puniceus]|uniref:Uncharacterized protein n=1 Tax=Deinococcus puniceus TaxID=1182568 RepID=A0A172T606_9DEIO|nr:hypothetical protein [Deinococcus puniceus]ANE42410.1 hypothetical protein SU48_00025 [Deinococcus puniceus]